MKIYTKSGDKGQTSLANGERVLKTHLRIACYGLSDELMSNLGYLYELIKYYDKEASNLFEKQLQELDSIISLLFSVGSELAAFSIEKNKMQALSEKHALSLEESIDKMEQELPKLTNFVLPKGNLPTSYAHVCRTVCRRFERKLCLLNEQKPLRPEITIYANRLSDWLFVFARLLSHRLKSKEVLWNG